MNFAVVILDFLTFVAWLQTIVDTLLLLYVIWLQKRVRVRGSRSFEILFTFLLVLVYIIIKCLQSLLSVSQLIPFTCHQFTFPKHSLHNPNLLTFVIVSMMRPCPSNLSKDGGAGRRSQSMRVPPPAVRTAFLPGVSRVMDTLGCTGR